MLDSHWIRRRMTHIGSSVNPAIETKLLLLKAYKYNEYSHIRHFYSFSYSLLCSYFAAKKIMVVMIVIDYSF